MPSRNYKTGMRKDERFLLGSILTTVRCLSFTMIHDRISKRFCRGRRCGNYVSVTGAFLVYMGEDIGVCGE